MRLTPFRNFIKLEAASGIFLLLAAVMALVVDNSPIAFFYQALFQTNFLFNQSLLFWINEGLMTLFFLLVSLELKREFVEGELASIRKMMLPSISALGGMLVPALIFIFINFSHPDALKGWSIPVATDIAFALGVLSLFGKRVPLGLKLFLMTLAIFDDIGAILIIAIFYHSSLSYFYLVLVLLCLLILQIFNYFNNRYLFPRIIIGVVLWICVLKSGVHATIAGVLFAGMLPVKKIADEKIAPAPRLEKQLHIWVAFLIMPLFAFANAGVSFVGFHLSILWDSVSLGIILGLFIGKQLGVMGLVWVAIRLKFASLPDHVSWGQIYGVALLCGIGFTMSLFLGTLAFSQDPVYLIEARLGVLLGSILSGILGAIVLSRAFQNLQNQKKSRRSPSETSS